MARMIMTPAEAAGRAPVRIAPSIMGSATGEMRVPPVRMPPSLIRDFRENPNAWPMFEQAVAKAITMSVNHPDTRPRVLASSILEERLRMCHNYAVLMRRAVKPPWTLRKICDQLPLMLIGGIKAGRRPEDLAIEEVGDTTAWAKDGHGNPEEMIVSDGNVEGDLPEELEETVQDIEESKL